MGGEQNEQGQKKRHLFAFPPRGPSAAAACTERVRGGPALYARQGPAGPDRRRQPSEGRVQPAAPGNAVRSQAFNYSHVVHGAVF